ncbi:MAG: mannose-6-phosphate isomerase, partial [Terrimicrobiaceae bacterium]
MGYLQQLGLEGSTYDKFPVVDVPGHFCWRGWEQIGAELLQASEKFGKQAVIAIECYSGVLDDEIVLNLTRAFPGALFIRTEVEAFRSPDEIDALVAPDLGGDDPIFGRLTRLHLRDFLDPDKVSAIRARTKSADRPVVIYGPGALLCCEPCLV